MPAIGMSESLILARIERGAKASDKLYTNDKGNLAGGVYKKGDDHWNFISECVRISIVSNSLHATDFAYVIQMEAEIIRWTLNLYKGDKESCGLCIGGGTESICLAMLAYRQRGLKDRGITKPNIVMSETAHPAHDKACHFFNIECRKIKMTSDFKADFDAMKAATNSNTVAIIASAPEYAFGNYDPVNDIAAFALSKDIGCHVDCCLGSYINPFIVELGYKVPY
jgi:sphinganine-1-phosphate aldolase